MIKSRDLVGKPIVLITNGEIVGKVRDVLIDPEEFRIAALVLASRPFRKPTMVLPRSVIHVFGKDVILIKSNEAMPRDNSLERVASLLAVSAEMKGRSIATEEGVRIGVMDDVIVNPQGQVVAYHLSRVFVSGPVAQTKEIPLPATRSIGPDLIIVDSKQIEGLV